MVSLDSCRNVVPGDVNIHAYSTLKYSFIGSLRVIINKDFFMILDVIVCFIFIGCFETLELETFERATLLYYCLV